ncbi:hypothetical protein NEHOM01_2357 [Nematocida homosporus]|uniref:uncharacterized protein n=1 Tax=Nematocida homosporus TaxID=1912981 RepID=UPI00221E480F|nr:uncharacterized protein NEHOM01_2357 [Nematocida homosporus]KAI5187770.1 hypothetical protein NEHOM01_2357 [Nematocida homosporus]
MYQIHLIYLLVWASQTTLFVRSSTPAVIPRLQSNHSYMFVPLISDSSIPPRGYVPLNSQKVEEGTTYCLISPQPKDLNLKLSQSPVAAPRVKKPRHKTSSKIAPLPPTNHHGSPTTQPLGSQESPTLNDPQAIPLSRPKDDLTPHAPTHHSKHRHRNKDKRPKEPNSISQPSSQHSSLYSLEIEEEPSQTSEPHLNQPRKPERPDSFNEPYPIAPMSTSSSTSTLSSTNTSQSQSSNTTLEIPTTTKDPAPPSEPTPTVNPDIPAKIINTPQATQVKSKHPSKTKSGDHHSEGGMVQGIIHTIISNFTRNNTTNESPAQAQHQSQTNQAQETTTPTSKPVPKDSELLQSAANSELPTTEEIPAIRHVPIKKDRTSLISSLSFKTNRTHPVKDQEFVNPYAPAEIEFVETLSGAMTTRMVVHVLNDADLEQRKLQTLRRKQDDFISSGPTCVYAQNNVTVLQDPPLEALNRDLDRNSKQFRFDSEYIQRKLNSTIASLRDWRRPISDPSEAHIPVHFNSKTCNDIKDAQTQYRRFYEGALQCLERCYAATHHNHLTLLITSQLRQAELINIYNQPRILEWLMLENDWEGQAAKLINDRALEIQRNGKDANYLSGIDHPNRMEVTRCLHLIESFFLLSHQTTTFSLKLLHDILYSFNDAYTQSVHQTDFVSIAKPAIIALIQTYIFSMQTAVCPLNRVFFQSLVFLRRNIIYLLKRTILHEDGTPDRVEGDNDDRFDIKDDYHEFQTSFSTGRPTSSNLADILEVSPETSTDSMPAPIKSAHSVISIVSTQTLIYDQADDQTTPNPVKPQPTERIPALSIKTGAYGTRVLRNLLPRILPNCWEKALDVLLASVTSYTYNYIFEVADTIKLINQQHDHHYNLTSLRLKAGPGIPVNNSILGLISNIAHWHVTNCEGASVYAIIRENLEQHLKTALAEHGLSYQVYLDYIREKPAAKITLRYYTPQMCCSYLMQYPFHLNYLATYYNVAYIFYVMSFYQAIASGQEEAHAQQITNYNYLTKTKYRSILYALAYYKLFKSKLSFNSLHSTIYPFSSEVQSPNGQNLIHFFKTDNTLFPKPKLTDFYVNPLMTLIPDLIHDKPTRPSTLFQ